MSSLDDRIDYTPRIWLATIATSAGLEAWEQPSRRDESVPRLPLASMELSRNPRTAVANAIRRRS